MIGSTALRAAAAVLAFTLLPLDSTPAASLSSGPASEIAANAFAIEPGGAKIRYAGNASLEAVNATVQRALVVVHGARRNAVSYERSLEDAVRMEPPGPPPIVVAPQFLSDQDVFARSLPASTLRWRRNDWDGGAQAAAPAPLSSFSVLDAIAARLADRSYYPSLREIVFVGFSAGGQMLQRYAVVGIAPGRLSAGGIRVRIVVSDPSSYVYFDARRPASDGGFAAFDSSACPEFNRWKYGPGDPPPYVARPVDAYEAEYVQRDVTYLVGTADDDPQQAALDRSCAGEAQGPNRVARSRNYVAYMRARHPGGTHQTFAESAGIAHDARAMFTSPCGLAVLFDRSRAACERSGNV